MQGEIDPTERPIYYFGFDMILEELLDGANIFPVLCLHHFPLSVRLSCVAFSFFSLFWSFTFCLSPSLSLASHGLQAPSCSSN
jgi:hypothetical protein